MVEPYLPGCVDSILAQTFADFELILVDDGSPDRCGAICDAYAEKDSRIRVIHKENGGLSDARNTGLDMAQGEYVGFVDSDDTIAPDMYEHLMDLVQTHNADVAGCGYSYVDDKGVEFYRNPSEPVKAVYRREDFIDRFYPQICWQIVPMVPDKVYRRTIFDHIRFPVGRIYEDIAVQLELFDRCQVIAVDDTYSYRYLSKRPGSIMNTSFSVRWFDGIEWAYNKFLYFQKSGNRAQQGYALAQYQMYYLRCFFPVYRTHTELCHGFKPWKRQYRRNVLRILTARQICKMDKLVTILLYINKSAAYKLCKKYLPQNLPVFLRH